MKEEWKKYYMFLETIREMGVINMYQAVPTLMNNFGVSKEEGKAILKNWIEHYEEISDAYYKKK